MLKTSAESSNQELVYQDSAASSNQKLVNQDSAASSNQELVNLIKSFNKIIKGLNARLEKFEANENIKNQNRNLNVGEQHPKSVHEKENVDGVLIIESKVQVEVEELSKNVHESHHGWLIPDLFVGT